jgi:2-pyrone-4,6-dicarboxylate lactonase
MRPNDLPCPTPDRTPRKPLTVFPAGACDTHAHICGPAVTFPYADERIYTPPDATFEDYLALLATLGVERAVLIQPSVYGTDNRALLEALSRVTSGLRGIAVVGDDLDAAMVERLHDAGIRGVRLNVVDHNGPRNVIPEERVRKLAKLIASFGWHIEFLINTDEAPGFAAAIDGLPVDVVVGHLGYPKSGAAAWLQSPALDDFLKLFARGRCWVKLTGPYRITSSSDMPYADVAPLAQRLADVNPKRLLWGTDWPHVMMKKPMPNDGDLSDLIADWLPDANLRRQVLVDNPAELYGFSKGEHLHHAPVSALNLIG